MENNETAGQQEKEITLRQILDFFLNNWGWFLISVVLCFGTGYLLTQTMTRMYVSSASIRVDEDYMRDASADITDFSGGGLFKSTSSVDNEVLVLKSRTLMLKVVKNLKAHISYYIDGRLRTQEIYSLLSPVELVVPDSLKRRFTVQLRLKSDTEYVAQVDDGPSEAHPYGVPVTQDSVTFTVNKRTNFSSYPDASIVVRVANPFKVAQRYATELASAPASKTTSIIQLSLTTPVAQKATDIINGLIDVYNKDAIDDKRRAAQNTADFIDERLRVVGYELETVDRDVERFKRDNESVDIVSESGIFLNSASQYEQLSVDVATQISLVESVGKYVRQYKGQYTLLPTNIGIEDPALNGSIELYNQMVLQRNRLLASGDVSQNPVIQELNAQILNMQSSLEESIRNLHNSLLIRQKSLAAQKKSISNRVRNVPTLEKEGQSIMRQQKIKESLYLFLLNKREENGLKLASAVPIAKVIDPASSTGIPVSPKVPVILLASFLFGLALPVGVLLLIDQLRTSIRGRKDVEAVVKAPIIGEIPSKEEGMSDRIVEKNSRDIVSEAFRIVRTNLDFMMTGEDRKVIMLTSTIPSEGKTFLSMNVASSLSIAGKRILLVDLDLRKSTLAKKFGHSTHHKGISNYLAGKENDIRSLISKGEVEGVDILYAGAIPPNPAELLISKRLDEAFRTLREDYDYIVVDTSPVGLVADTVISNRVADLTLYTIRVGRSDRRSLESIQALWVNKTLKNMAIILSDATSSSRYGYGYGYNYGYGYGYHYGYGGQYGEHGTGNRRKERLGKKIKRFFRL